MFMWLTKTTCRTDPATFTSVLNTEPLPATHEFFLQGRRY
jgi:hypothetical protein